MTDIKDPNQPPRQKLINEVVRLLGGGSMIDLELDQEDYDTAFQVAMDVYRQRSGNALKEDFVFLDVQPDVSRYRLIDEVQEVREISRRTIGGTAGGAAIDPFSLAFTNNIYMTQNPGALGTTGAGTLATYDFAMQFQNLIGRMFGMWVNFDYDSAQHMLTLHRKFSAVETIMLHVYTERDENNLLSDPYARPWLRSYTLATCKMMVGQARGLFSSVASPQGGFSLNGAEMKAEAKDEITNLETQLREFMDQHSGMPFVIG